LGWKGDKMHIALRDIEKDEELTYDYCTSDIFDWGFTNCLCGSENCRKIVGPDDWKREDLQKKYKGYFIPWLRKKIKLMNKNL
jgi:uncharacterized protein